MKLEHLVVIAVRLFALAIAYEAFKSIMGLVVYFGQIKTPSTITVYLGTSIVLFIVSTILWKFPTLIARKIANFPAMSEVEVNSENSEKILQVGLVILGIYFLYYVISDFASWGYYWLSISRDSEYDLSFNAQQKADVFATFVELGIAMFLIIGSSKIVRAIKKLRYG